MDALRRIGAYQRAIRVAVREKWFLSSFPHLHTTLSGGSRVISEAGLEELNYYEYSGTDRSVLAKYVMQPFWNWLIEFMPLNIAPNDITLVGFVGMIFATCLSLSYAPTLTEPVPTYAIVISLVLVFLYQTLDALDGKQARRTRNSTPLGQLFDHGCDSVSMCCFAFLGGAIARQGANDTVFLLFFFSSLIAFFCAQWEEYWTGVIDLGEIGVTEGQLLGVLLYICAAIFGTNVFLKPAFTLGPLSMTIGELVLSVFTTAFIATTFQNMYRVNKATHGFEQKKAALLQLLPVVSLTFAFLLWIKVSPADLINTHPVPLLVAAGIFYPACVERMVIARLTKDPVPYVYSFTFPVFLGPIQALFIGNAHYDLYLVRGCAILAILAYLQFAYQVIHQITEYFDIKAFSINRPLQWPLKKRRATRGRSKSPRGAAKKTPTKKANVSPSPARRKSTRSRTPRKLVK